MEISMKSRAALRCRSDETSLRLTITAGLLTLGLLIAFAVPAWAEVAPLEGEKPATVTLGEDGINTLLLTERAVERTGVTLGEVTTGPRNMTVIPISAGLYFPDGSTWVYLALEGFSYKRAPITIHDVTPAGVYLTSGPEVGTSIVTTGVPEFWGLESGIGG